MELQVLKGLVTLPKGKRQSTQSTQPPLTQTSEPVGRIPQAFDEPEKKKRGRKPKSLMTFTMSRGNFIVDFN